MTTNLARRTLVAGVLWCLVITPQAAAEVDPIYQLLMMGPQEQFIHRREARLQQLPPPPQVPRVTAPTHNEIDCFIVAHWQEASLPAATEPPPICTDPVYLRRVYVDVLGRIPTLEETGRFIDDPHPDKRHRLIDELLGRHDEYADHWTPFWEEAIASNPAPIVGGIPSRGNYQDWIRQHFQKNTPFDLLVAELIDPRMPGHRPSELHDILGKPTQSGLILNQTHTNTIQTAALVGQVFLGTGMKCASCHDHFENEEWPQSRFLAFGGLFQAADLEQIRCEKRIGGPIAARFPFEIPGAPTMVPEDLEGRLHLAAFMITDPLNPRFSQTLVNRLWRRYLGLGLFEPIDDFRIDSPASHPELLAWLAHDFMTHGYDMTHTVRKILNSRTYQLRYDPQREDRFDTAKRDAPRYCQSPTLRKLTAEQLIDSMRLAAKQSLSSEERLYRVRGTTPLARSLSRPASRNEISTSRPEDTAVVQALELLNGQEYHDLVYQPGGLVQTLIAQSPDRAIQSLYLALLSRDPTFDEQRAIGAYLQPVAGTANPTSEQVGDVLWALMTSAEFQYVH